MTTSNYNFPPNVGILWHLVTFYLLTCFVFNVKTFVFHQSIKEIQFVSLNVIKIALLITTVLSELKVNVAQSLQSVEGCSYTTQPDDGSTLLEKLG